MKIFLFRIRMVMLIKSYFGCSMKSQANRTCSSWMTSVTQTLGENNTAVHKSSIRFLEHTEDHFLLQMLDMLTRNNSLLDLLLIN